MKTKLVEDTKLEIKCKTKEELERVVDLIRNVSQVTQSEEGWHWLLGGKKQYVFNCIVVKGSTVTGFREISIYGPVVPLI